MPEVVQIQINMTISHIVKSSCNSQVVKNERQFKSYLFCE